MTEDTTSEHRSWFNFYEHSGIVAHVKESVQCRKDSTDRTTLTMQYFNGDVVDIRETKSREGNVPDEIVGVLTLTPTEQALVLDAIEFHECHPRSQELSYLPPTEQFVAKSWGNALYIEIPRRQSDDEAITLDTQRLRATKTFLENIQGRFDLAEQFNDLEYTPDNPYPTP